MSLYSNTIRLQKTLAKKVITKDCIGKIQNICAVDVSYKKDRANSSAVVMRKKDLDLLEVKSVESKINVPYVPGLLMLRETPPILSVLKLLKTKYDVLLIDGNGMLHPRKFGLACYVGMLLNKPTVGIAKSLLCGEIKKGYVELDKEVVGKIIEKKKGKKLYVSVGNKISLTTAVKLMKSLIKEGQWMPEPMRLADKYSKNTWKYSVPTRLSKKKAS